MGEVNGFLHYKRQGGGYRPVEERIKDYRDVAVPPSKEVLAEQGARCMDCGIPFCHALGCPLGNLIPEWNDFVYKGQWKEAWARLEKTNNFPEFTGRLCPALCEASCTLSINDSPVTIREIELAIVEKAFESGWVVPRPPKSETGRRVAVIGSGPAGLAAAQQLRRKGHRVTVFEKKPKVGGFMRYGIPDFKMEKNVIDRRIDVLKAEGIEFETNVTVGADITAGYLMKKYDSILITAGAGDPRDLNVPGRELDGVHFAMEYLESSNRFVGGEISEPEINAKGKRVLVIGGGDTGSDCVGTANRQGALSVSQIEIMPKPQECTSGVNPSWPDWPRILRTSSSHLEGCDRDWSLNTRSFSGKEGRVNAANLVSVEWSKDDTGRFVMNEKSGTEKTLEVDLVLLAMGFVHVDQKPLNGFPGLEYDGRGNVAVDDAYRTSLEGVFAAGDAATGASLIVRAMTHGRRAAEEVDRYLQKMEA